jgi:hypothetical protein
VPPTLKQGTGPAGLPASRLQEKGRPRVAPHQQLGRYGFEEMSSLSGQEGRGSSGPGSIPSLDQTCTMAVKRPVRERARSPFPAGSASQGEAGRLGLGHFSLRPRGPDPSLLPQTQGSRSQPPPSDLESNPGLLLRPRVQTPDSSIRPRGPGQPSLCSGSLPLTLSSPSPIVPCHLL